jgi:predicted Zn-dependent peptidase
MYRASDRLSCRRLKIATARRAPVARASGSIKVRFDFSETTMTELKRLALLLASVSALAACATAPTPTAAPPPPQVAAAPVVSAAPAEPQAAPLSALVQDVNIPHTTFHLANGLTVIVHEDHKTPVVAVSVWYNVGSKDEPPTKDGYAHLFEHIMFTGSDNLPGDYFKYLQQLGATDYNGTTWFDRTNYFETVPKAGLDRALFMESDRMGYLLGSLNQKRLDAQRAVVENEKRQDDNEPGGLVQYELLADLFPPGHPYHHPTIGSIPDLDKANLADVKEWFINHYGPNNAVLVLAGDVTPAEAQPLVEKYFGPIARGPVNVPAAADVPTLAAPKMVVMKDRVAAVQLQRDWAVPGLTDIHDLAALDLGSDILGGLASSRLQQILVRDEKLAVSASADLEPFQRISIFEIDASVKPGVDPALVDKRISEILADFIANGPTADEVQRAATDEVSGRIHGLEKVGGQGGKAVALAQGQLLAGDSDYYKKSLDAYASMTPAQIKAAMQRWITRPAVEITIEPGDRPPYQESTYKPGKTKGADIKIPVIKRPVPPIGNPEPLHFPAIQHASLSNGIKVEYAQRTAVPVTLVTLSFDAGYSADAPNGRGLQNFTMDLLDQGAAGLTSQQVAEREERLGAAISADGGADRSQVGLSALSTNLAPSLDLLADVAERPMFDPTEIERVRAQELTGIAEQQKDPNGIAARALPPLLYGADYPYGTTSAGDPNAVKGFTRADIVGFQQRWLRPDNAEIFVVSDRPLAEILPMLDQRFGHWAPPPLPKGVKQFPAAPQQSPERIVLIDRPGSPQSVIVGGELTPINPEGPMAAITAANDVLGGSFLSRMNMDVRETKGWSYGVNGGVSLHERQAPYVVSAPVQADRTGDAIAAIRADMRDFLTTKPVTDEELKRTITNLTDQLPGEFETAGSVLSAMQTQALLHRPDNYYELLQGQYEGLTKPQVDAALRGVVNPDGFVWVVVGDAAKVKPQLDKLGIPVQEMQPR